MPTTNTLPNDRTKSSCDLSSSSTTNPSKAMQRNSNCSSSNTTATNHISSPHKKSKSTPSTPLKTPDKLKCLIVTSNSNSLRRSKKSTKDETFVWTFYYICFVTWCGFICHSTSIASVDVVDVCLNTGELWSLGILLFEIREIAILWNNTIFCREANAEDTEILQKLFGNRWFGNNPDYLV